MSAGLEPESFIVTFKIGGVPCSTAFTERWRAEAFFAGCSADQEAELIPMFRALLRQERAEQPEPLELAPIDHVAYVRDCLTDTAVWPRFERPVLQALIDEIDRLTALMKKA